MTDEQDIDVMQKLKDTKETAEDQMHALYFAIERDQQQIKQNREHLAKLRDQHSRVCQALGEDVIAARKAVQESARTEQAKADHPKGDTDGEVHDG